MMLDHLRVIEAQPGILAFYDGRVAGHRFADGPNWVDDGALSLGVASYALIAGDQAIVYDTHVSVPHGRFIRAELQRRGVSQIRVVLSHWHLDHVAGTEAFAGCEVIANVRTQAHLSARKVAIEAGTDHGFPCNIHSDDATVIWLPRRRVLLAGDTVEDCVTYVGEPQAFATHLADLARLQALGADWVLPNHGSDLVIAAGGYGPGLLAATVDYIGQLQRGAPLAMAEAIAPWLADGTLQYFAPYEAVHRQNLQRVAEVRGG
ncbi:MAG: hypothetical protein FD162_3485 [Rhodobacteraceae bacterium]|nr:MAG: hypothetical protein FD162_3485 [Paracoccaceae bacterium]